MGFENGKLVRVSLVATHLTGNTAVNTFHYDLEDSAVPGNPANDPQALADAFRDDVLPKFKGLFSSDWTISPVTVQEEKDPQNPGDARSAWVSGSAAAGNRTISSDLLPTAICAVVTLNTPFIGRRFRGRIFVPGSWTEADQNAGVFQATATGIIDLYVASIPREPDIVSGASASTAKWCVYSRTQRGLDLDPYASPVVSVNRRTALHWLRSRER